MAGHKRRRSRPEHSELEIVIDPDAIFSDEEVRQILSPAADRQKEADRTQGKVDRGLTRHHLSEVAREAGIAPSHVQAAAKRSHAGSIPAATEGIDHRFKSLMDRVELIG